MIAETWNVALAFFIIMFCFQTLRRIDRRSKRMAAEYRAQLASASADETDRANLVHRAEFAMSQCQNVVNMYRSLVMDTPEDQEKHRIAMEASDDAIAKCRAYLRDGTLDTSA